MLISLLLIYSNKLKNLLTEKMPLRNTAFIDYC